MSGQVEYRVTAIILTFNSEATIERVIESCQPCTQRILVVDSFSSDRTLQIAAKLGCEVVQHEFINYSVQRNWAQDYLRLKDDHWVLHLDSDETLSPELAQSIKELFSNKEIPKEGYLIRKKFCFMGKPIRFGSLNPSWHLRLYRGSKGKCEEREYDQHFLVDGEVGKLKGVIYDLQEVNLERWTFWHNKWSTAEAQEVIHSREKSFDGNRLLLPGRLGPDPRMRKRWAKNRLYYRLPPLFRAFLFFIYSYVFRLGFLDGKVGLIYHVLQSFWFRFLVDAKIAENDLKLHGKATQ